MNGMQLLWDGLIMAAVFCLFFFPAAALRPRQPVGAGCGAAAKASALQKAAYGKCRVCMFALPALYGAARTAHAGPLPVGGLLAASCLQWAVAASLALAATLLFRARDGGRLVQNRLPAALAFCLASCLLQSGLAWALIRFSQPI